jgi:opacity protein-like surface antigen
MKKMYLMAVIAIAAINVNAQDAAFYQGSSTVTIGYGFPNIGKSILKIGNSAGVTDSKITGVGPIHVKYEYAVSDKVGVGVSLGYVSFADEYTQDNGGAAPYKYKDAITSFGILARFNYHFGGNEKVDPYVGLGAGYNNWTAKTTTNDPDGIGNTFTIPIKIGFEGGVGVRYYFTPNIGAYAELGYGKSILQGGLAFKF